MYDHFNLVYLIDTDIWHELHRIKWEYFMQGYCEKQDYIAVKHFVLYIISTNKKENKTAVCFTFELFTEDNGLWFILVSLDKRVC